MSDWFGDALAPLFFSIVMLSVLGFCSALTYDGVKYGRATFDEQVACKALRMEPERKFMTEQVVCVPVITRQDTTTVNLNQTVR